MTANETGKRTALVTGGSRGIGRAICVKLASMNMDIAFTYNSDDEGAAETKALCEKEGAKVCVFKADVSDSEACGKVVSELASVTGGHIDVLVNNAGITRDGLAIRMTDEDFDKVIDANLKGTFYMLRAVSKLMLKAKYGRIINISSIVGIRGNAGQINYAASKAAIIGMTKSLAKELASRKITVNAVAPGMIKTKMTGAMTEDAHKKMEAMIPFGTMGEPSDVAEAVAFFAGEGSAYITGQVLCVDGGLAV